MFTRIMAALSVAALVWSAMQGWEFATPVWAFTATIWVFGALEELR